MFFTLPEPVSPEPVNENENFKLTPKLEHLNLYGMNFKLKGTTLTLLNPNYSAREILKIWDLISLKFKSVDEKGFVERSKIVNPMFSEIEKYLKSSGVKTKKDLGSSVNTYSLWYNFLLINLIYLANLVLKRDVNNTFDEEGLDTLADLGNLKLKLMSFLDPYLRLQIQKRGITLIQNTYVGYDTEYINKDHKKFLNQIVSAQLAIQSRTLIKIPLYKTHDISYAHPLTSEVTTYYKPSNNDWGNKSNPECKKTDSDSESETWSEMTILNQALKDCVVKIRCTLFSSIDGINRKITERLHCIEGISFFEDLKKDHIVFALPLTDVNSRIFYPRTLALTDVVDEVKKMSLSHERSEFCKIVQEISSVEGVNKLEKLRTWYDFSKSKPRSRTTISFSIDDKVSLNLIKNQYICSHYNASDISILTDFSDYKKSVNIVAKSFVTLGKPLLVEGVNVYIRDTILLTPQKAKSLNNLGKLYDQELGFKKGIIPVKYITKMDEYLKIDPKSFEEYALNDAKIVLKHATVMEEFNFSLKQLGVPITLSSIGKRFVLKKWDDGFKQNLPYQISGDLLLGNSDEVQTPKGLFATGQVGLHMSYFIGNYKGGRNESFMYGVDERGEWFDYDLTSAYTTAMSNLSLPDYRVGVVIDPVKVLGWSNSELLDGYLILNVSFKFPPETKYPSIPCYVDQNTTVYPLQGEGVISGPEFILARNQKCEFVFKSAFYIPPVVQEKRLGVVKIKMQVQPFHDIIKELQSRRREYGKDHMLNALYKELANSIYGNVVRGMSNKKSFDVMTGKMIRVRGTELSNPILASWTTAFIRSVVGECLHNVRKIGGQVVSVTTDGFITNIKNLEEKLLSLPEKEIPLLKKYRLLRQSMGSDNYEALELKNGGVGIISWSTRGQLGIESKIKATTGFQSQGYTHEELVNMLKKTFKESEKEIEFTLSSIRSAKEVFKQGGHVTTKLRDQKFRIKFDNRREIIDHDAGILDSVDMSGKLLDSKPLQSIEECSRWRFLSKISGKKPYLKSYSVCDVRSSYRSYIEVGVRNFIKGYLSKSPCFGLKGNEFANYGLLIQFINGFNQSKGIKISRQSVSQLKNRCVITKPVPRTEDNIAFTDYVQSVLPYFDTISFFKV